MGFSLLTANREWMLRPELIQIAKRHGRTTSQIIFRFALDVGMIRGGIKTPIFDQGTQKVRAVWLKMSIGTKSLTLATLLESLISQVNLAWSRCALTSRCRY